MSGEILFLAHRLPFPPDRGDRIRSCHVLQALAQIAPVHVGCLADDKADLAYLPQLDELAASHCVALRSKLLALAGVQALLRGQPVSLTAFRSSKLANWVSQLLASGRIDAVYVFSGQMGQYVPPSWTGRLVVDLVDVDSAKFDAYAQASAMPQSWIHAREGRLMAQVEADLAARAEHTLLVSDAEAALLASRVSGARDIRGVPNGIDAAFFDPDTVTPASRLAGSGPHIVFTGQMDYAPNVAAVQRMAHAIMPAIRLSHADAQFHIVGREPVAAVRALDGVHGCTVHGAVPDVRPYLAAANLVATPLSIARGIQNKVLEAMAMARPVLLSPEAATGIPAQDGRDFVIAHDDAEFVSKALNLLGETAIAEQIGAVARAFVLQDMSWSAALADLPQLLGLSPAPPGCRNAA